MSGYDVMGIASNGDEAIKMYREFSEKPDIVILDYRMPIKNGIDALKEILQIDKESKVIFASADRSIKQEVFKFGAIEFLDKPFSQKKLVNAVNKCLDIEDV
jgi:two-component system chemotaxis response regulator CheY